MIGSKSRYVDTPAFTGSSEGETIFRGIRARAFATATGVVEHEVQEGDRLDHLARHYYNNDRLWWRILDANPELFYGQSFRDGGADGVMLSKTMQGTVILIPRLTGD